MATGSLVSIASLLLRCRRLALLSAVAALVAPQAARASYGWPVRPFDRQHPVRGFFGDPRIDFTAPGVRSTTFHFGIDVAAPDGTAVYATTTGRVVWQSYRPETILVYAGDGRMFGYWHIVPAVRTGAYAIAYRTVLGHIAKGWEHVHLAEFVGGKYVNPLRRGALTPYADTTRPTIHAFGFERHGKGLGRVRLSGRFDLVVEALDETPMTVPGRWADRPVTPASVRWRTVDRRGHTSPWRTAVDFSWTIPSPSLYHSVYATWTRQNKPWRDGRYRVLLAHDWDSRSLANGTHLLEVEARDTPGNSARRSVRFSVAN
jgi:hypothetical protein